MGGILQGKGKLVTFGRQRKTRGFGTIGMVDRAHRIRAGRRQDQRGIGLGGGMAHPPPLPTRRRHQRDDRQHKPRLHAATTVSRIFDHLAKAAASRV